MLTEKGSGLQSGFKSAVSWVARLEFESDDKVVRPLKMDREVFDGSGRLIFTESQRFDFGSKKAIFSSENILSGKRQKKEFRFSGDVVNRLILGLYARRLLEQGKREAQLELLSGEPRLYKFKLYVMDTEAIDINGSMKNAYKLCLDPELGLLNIAKILLPKAYVWHSAKPKFEWLRYEGLESGLNSPMVQIRTSERSL